VNSLLPGGTAIRPDWRGVGKNQARRKVDFGDVVHAGQTARDIIGVDAGTRRSDVSALAAEMRHTQGQELSALIEG
jgi:hypothetical protein